MPIENEPVNESAGINMKDPRDSAVRRLSIARLSEDKIEEILYRLSRQVGLFVLGDNALVFISKAQASLVKDFQLSPERQLIIFAISDLKTDLREFQVIFSKIGDAISNIFSPRELNLELVSDFISYYINSRIYGHQDKAPAIEFVLVEFLKETKTSKTVSVSVRPINFMGECQELSDGRSAILGCTYRESNEQLIKKLKQNKILKLAPDEIENKFREVIESFKDMKDENGESLSFEGEYSKFGIAF